MKEFLDTSILAVGAARMVNRGHFVRDVPLFKFSKDSKCEASNTSNNSPLTDTTVSPVLTSAPVVQLASATSNSPSSVSSDSRLFRAIFLSSNARQQGQYSLAMYILEHFNWYGLPATEIVCLRDYHVSEANGRCAQETKLIYSANLQQCRCKCEYYDCATFSHKDSECQIHTTPCVPEVDDPGWKTFTRDGIQFTQVEAVVPPVASSISTAQASSTGPPASTALSASSAPASTEATPGSSSVVETSGAPGASAAPSASQPASSAAEASQPASSAAPGASQPASSGAPGADDEIPDLDDNDLDDDDLTDGLDELVESTGAAAQPSATQPAATQNPSQPAATQGPESAPIPATAQFGVHRRLLQGTMEGDMATTSLMFHFDSYWTNKQALPAGPPPEGLPTTIFSQMIKDASEELRIKIPSEIELKQVESVFDLDQNGYVSFVEFSTPLSPFIRRMLGLPQDI